MATVGLGRLSHISQVLLHEHGMEVSEMCVTRPQGSELSKCGHSNVVQVGCTKAQQSANASMQTSAEGRKRAQKSAKLQMTHMPSENHSVDFVKLEAH